MVSDLGKAHWSVKNNTEEIFYFVSCIKEIECKWFSPKDRRVKGYELAWKIVFVMKFYLL